MMQGPLQHKYPPNQFLAAGTMIHVAHLQIFMVKQ